MSRRRRASIAISLLASGGAIALAYFAFARSAESPEALREAAARWHRARVPADEPSLTENGRVRLVVFSDYQCPFCGDVVPMLDSIVQAYHRRGVRDIELVERDFPLDAKCNSTVGRSVHPIACDSAVAVRLARRRSEAEARALSEWLYQNHATMSSSQLDERLASLGLGEAFVRQYDEVLREIEKDVTLATRLGIAGTPTLFINGRAAVVRDRHVLEALIDYELSLRQASGTWSEARPASLRQPG